MGKCPFSVEAPSDPTIIRQTQPYVHGKTKRPYHSLSVLATFNNVDKHRTLQPVIFLPDNLWYEIADYRDCSITRTPRQARRRVMQVGAELALFPVKRLGPNPYMHVKYQLATIPAIYETLSLETWLTQTSKFMGSLLGVLSGIPAEARPLLEFVGSLS